MDALENIRQDLSLALETFKRDQRDGLEQLQAVLNSINYEPLTKDFEQEVFTLVRYPSHDRLRIAAIKWQALINRLEMGWEPELTDGGGRRFYEGIL